MNLPFNEKIKRADRDNAIDVYIGDDYMDVLADGAVAAVSSPKSRSRCSRERKSEHGWIRCTDVALGSDAFFPFGDNVSRRAHKKRREVHRAAGRIHPGRSMVIEACNEYGIAMYFSGMRLFHH